MHSSVEASPSAVAVESVTMGAEVVNGRGDIGSDGWSGSAGAYSALDDEDGGGV
jgi:hypothetical protein